MVSPWVLHKEGREVAPITAPNVTDRRWLWGGREAPGGSPGLGGKSQLCCYFALCPWDAPSLSEPRFLTGIREVRPR